MSDNAKRKYFSVEEANKTLPYVRRIVEDIVGQYEEWRERIHGYEKLAAERDTDDGESSEQERIRIEVDRIAMRINEHINELSSVGCVFKGFEGGLVDFYSQLNGRDVFLCWKLGEPEVGHWHEIEGGFSGRQPLVAEHVKGDTK